MISWKTRYALPNDIIHLSNMTTVPTASSILTTPAASPSTALVASIVISITPKRGGSHVDYGIYHLGGE